MTLWKQIHIAPKYEASDGGQIRNARTKKILKPFNDPLQEYDRISIYEAGRKQKVMVHFLVAWAFLGPPPPGGKHEIDHVNTDIHDNRPSNLKYVTRKENRNNPITILKHEFARLRREIVSGKKSRDEVIELLAKMKKL